VNLAPRTKLLTTKGWMWLIGLFLFAAIVIPLLNRMVPVDSMFYVSDLVVETLGKYMCYAILALAIDLIWGYTGILSLGHAFFFALGAYIMGMHLAKYMNDVLLTVPDFMAYMPWKEFPWFWNGFQHFSYGLLMALVIPGLIALAIGYVSFRSRIKGVYFAILTQALTFAMYGLFLVNETGFGGNNGFTNFKGILGFTLTNATETQKLGLMSDVATTKLGLYVVTVTVLCFCFLLCRYIVSSKLGRVLRAIRDEESRVAFSGYNTNNYKLFVWTVSAVLCAIGGALFVPQVGIINPSEMAPIKSIEAVVWVAVGGRGSLIGALLGSGVVNGTKTILTTGSMAEYWLFILGGLSVIVTLFFRGGLIDKNSYIKIAQSVGRLLGARTDKYVFSSIVPLLVGVFYFGFIALIFELVSADFSWTEFKQQCLYAMLVLPIYIVLNSLYQLVKQGSFKFLNNCKQLAKDISDVFVSRAVISKFFYGLLFVGALIISQDSGKMSGLFVLFSLFIVPLLLLGAKIIPLKLNNNLSKFMMLIYLIVAVLFSVFPDWLLKSGVHIGLVLLLVVVLVPIIPLIKNVKTNFGLRSILAIVLMAVIYFFLFFFTRSYFPIDAPESFFLRVVHAFFSFSDNALDASGIKANMFFALCSLYMAYYFWRNHLAKKAKQ